MNFDPLKLLLTLDWTGMIVPTLSVGEKILRTVLVYGFLVLALRLAGKRELAQLNPFDFIVLLVLSNTLQNAVIGSDNSVIGGFVGAGTLLLVNMAMNRWLARHPRVESALVGRKRLLIVDGQVVAASLKRENLTLQELEIAAHKQGISTLANVESAEIEPDGDLFFIAKPPAPDEHRHQELIARIDALTREVAALRAEINPRR